jgi:subtilase family serine protease
LAAFLAAVAFGFGSTAMAQAPQAVERSGATYHVPVCPGPVAAGTARCHAHVVTDAEGRPMARPAATNAAPAGYSPSDLRSAYNVSGSGSSSVTVAIVDAYGYPNAESDLATYRAQYGLPPCTTANGCFRKVNQTGGTDSYPRMDVGWAQEQALDLDMVSAICPGCKILLVQATSATYGNLAAAVNRAAAMGAHVISNSYGGGESGSQGYEAAYNHAGVAITVSTGDSGYGVAFPATSPHVTAVGGTALTRAANARGWAESAWSGAGSGCSAIYAKPMWQLDYGCARRMEADVSAVADPNTGVAVYGPVTPKSSAWLVFGGTSVSAPLVGGLYGVNGGAVNYGADPYNNQNALFDVTSGKNGTCSPAYFCTAVSGYDGPTGLGTPNGTTAF